MGKFELDRSHFERPNRSSDGKYRKEKGKFSESPVHLLTLGLYGVIYMSSKKIGFLALTFILVSAVLVPALLTHIASAQCSAMNSVNIVQLFNNPNDYKWYGSWDPRFDSDWQTHYRISYVHDCDVRDYDRNAARDCDRCERCASVSDYRCDLFGCGWVRYYGCSECGVR